MYIDIVELVIISSPKSAQEMQLRWRIEMKYFGFKRWTTLSKKKCQKALIPLNQRKCLKQFRKNDHPFKKILNKISSWINFYTWLTFSSISGRKEMYNDQSWIILSSAHSIQGNVKSSIDCVGVQSLSFMIVHNQIVMWNYSLSLHRMWGQCRKCW